MIWHIWIFFYMFTITEGKTDCVYINTTQRWAFWQIIVFCRRAAWRGWVPVYIICDPLCENPAKVIIVVILCFLQKNILHMVKNILWKIYLYIFNIDVRSRQRLKLKWNYIWYVYILYIIFEYLYDIQLILTIKSNLLKTSAVSQHPLWCTIPTCTGATYLIKMLMNIFMQRYHLDLEVAWSGWVLWLQHCTTRILEMLGHYLNLNKMKTKRISNNMSQYLFTIEHNNIIFFLTDIFYKCIHKMRSFQIWCLLQVLK